MKRLKLTAAILSSLALAACGGDDGKDGANGTDGANGAAGDNGVNSLIAQVVLEAGHGECPLGGVAIHSGLDVDASGMLDESEITETNYVCNNDAFELQLLHFADVDGGRDIINNAVRFSALVKSFKSDYANTLLLSSGDNWIMGRNTMWQVMMRCNLYWA